jgi:1-deoxy-D-xylulose-5-phosphate synthase
MNNAAYINSKIVVVLNDNGQVSLPTGQPSAGGVIPAGALSGYTGRLLTSNTFKNFRDVAKSVNNFLPGNIQDVNKRIDQYVRGMATGGTLFEELGFYYVGPVDAHDIENLVPILENIRDKVPDTKPVLLHVKSVKGKGYTPAEQASDRMHGVAKFDVSTGKQVKVKAKTQSLTSVFANSLINIAEKDRDVVAITAAMPGGTGIDKFGRRFPKRTFDVGIAEQHAVTFAAGMAVEGSKPFCAIYSTFLQRGYDQVIHDVALQKLPVRFILDRAGLVGNDGATHHGTFDLAYMGCIPDIVIMAPSDEIELQNMIETAYNIDDKPSAVRYPRGNGYGSDKLQEFLNYNVEDSLLQERGKVLEIGKGKIVKKGDNDSPAVDTKVTILSLGSRLLESVIAAREIEKQYPEASVTVADARFMKPLDTQMIDQLANDSDILVTIEEGSVGGFGSHVIDFLQNNGNMDNGKLYFRSMFIPDEWIEQGPQKDQYDIAKLNSPDIVSRVSVLIDKHAKKGGSNSVQKVRANKSLNQSLVAPM